MSYEEEARELLAEMKKWIEPYSEVELISSGGVRCHIIKMTSGYGFNNETNQKAVGPYKTVMDLIDDAWMYPGDIVMFRGIRITEDNLSLITF